MRISAKTEYACRALLEMALHWPDSTPVPVGTIAKSQKIPLKFLTLILIELKRFGYVDSSRGKKGGYILLRPPKDIQLSEVVKAFNELRLTVPSTQPKSSAFQGIWDGMDDRLLEYLNGFDFEQLSQKQRRLNEAPMYSI